MKQRLCLAVVICCCVAALAQAPAGAPVRPMPATPPAAQQQGNAASATQDNSGTSGDQITKPAGEKQSTLIGCLSGPDKDGKFTLRSMSYRAGVEVLGPDNLKDDSGSKVKLTGKWQAPAQQAGTAAGMRRFQVTDIEVVANRCSAPSETTPVSKNKKASPTTYNAPSSPDSK